MVAGAGQTAAEDQSGSMSLSVFVSVENIVVFSAQHQQYSLNVYSPAAEIGVWLTNNSRKVMTDSWIKDIICNIYTYKQLTTSRHIFSLCFYNLTQQVE